MTTNAERSSPHVHSPKPDGPSGWASRFRSPFTAVLMIASVATAMRLAAVPWGLPFGLNPDEDVIIEGAVDMASRNSFEPTSFDRPDHVELKLSNIAYLAFAVLAKGMTVEAAFAEDPTPFFVISRTITVAFSVALVVLAYAVGRMFSQTAGVSAAFLFAFFPLFTTNSSFASPDIPLTCMVLVVVWACMRYLNSNSWRDLVLASMAVAVAVAIKYPGAIASFSIATVIVINAWRHGSAVHVVSRGLGTAAVAAASLFAISPVLFTNFTAVWEQLNAQAGSVHPGADGLGTSGNLAYYVQTFVASSGVVVVVLAVVGAVASWRERRVQAVPMLLGALYWLSLSTLALHWGRWGLPMYTTPLLFAAVGVDVVLKATRRSDSRAVMLVVWVAVGLVAANLVVGSTAAVASRTATDTRVAAMDELRSIGIDESNSLSEGYTPFGPQERYEIFDEFVATSAKSGRLRVVPELRDRVDYVVVSSNLYGRYVIGDRYPQEKGFYRALEQHPLAYSIEPVAPRRLSPFEPVSIVEGLLYIHRVREGYSGPTIRAFDVR